MRLEDFVLVLRDQLSSLSRILTDHESPDFRASLERWSDIGSQTPGAIIRLASEADVVHTVRRRSVLAQSRFQLMCIAGQRSNQSIDTLCSCVGWP